MKNKILGKRVLIISPFFYPELISTGKYNTYLANTLLQRGCNVSVICSYPLYPDWVANYTNKQLPGIQIYRGGLHVKYPRSAVLRRLVLEIWFAFFATWKLLKVRNDVDIVISIFPPNLCFLFLNFILPKQVHKVGIVHDIQGIMAESTKSGFRKVIASLISRLEKRVYGACNKVICLSDSMYQYITDIYEIPENRCVVHYPFVTLEAGENEQLAEIFPDNYKHVVYSGALGEKQRPQLLFELFNRLTSSDNNVMCHIFSGGPKFKELKELSSKLKLQHILFHDLVPDSQVKSLYSHSDVQVLPQAEGTSAGAFPSKLPNLLAAGVPIFVICDENSEVGNLLSGIDTVRLEHIWNVNELSKRLLEYLDQVTQKSHGERREQNRGVIERRFAVDNVAQTILNT